MSDEDATGNEGEGAGNEGEAAGDNIESQRLLIASVEELRALLAPLSPEDRARVLQLARDLHERPQGG
jgi:hypothetical protein